MWKHKIGQKATLSKVNSLIENILSNYPHVMTLGYSSTLVLINHTLWLKPKIYQ